MVRPTKRRGRPIGPDLAAPNALPRPTTDDMASDRAITRPLSIPSTEKAGHLARVIARGGRLYAIGAAPDREVWR